jgi:hypothetical protein
MLPWRTVGKRVCVRPGGVDRERRDRSGIAALLGYGEFIARRRMVVEPFLIVGIVAAVRRLIVISAEAENLLGTAKFRDVMLEIGVLAMTVLLLGVTVLVLRIRQAGDEMATGSPK